tara:strand:- start:123 stop:395 length:273 start_codon:yes stop_codon:yes gene_type:complete
MKNKYLIISKRNGDLHTKIGINKDGFVQYRNFSDEPLVMVVEEETPFTKQDAFNQFASMVETTEERKLNINHFNIFSEADIDDIKYYWGA